MSDISKETTFTPGTWHASRNFRVVGDSPGIDIGSSNGTNVATVHFSHYDQDAREVLGNANLFAASKELHNALSLFVKQWNACGPNSDFGRYFKNVRDAAVEALARVRGEDRSHEGK